MKILIKILDLLKTGWGYVAVLIAIVTTVYALNSHVENKAVEKYKKNQDLTSLESKVDRLIESDSIRNVTMNHILLNQFTMTNQVKDVKSRLNVVIEVVAKKDNELYERLFNIQQSVEEVKKNETPSGGQ